MTAEAVRTALKGLIDPETGRDIVAMGLVYAVEVEGGAARVEMTTTTRGCPLAEALRLGAEAVVAKVPGVARAEVVLTYDPPWTPDRMA